MASIFFLILSVTVPARTLVSTVCDCTQPKVSGLIDTRIPDYCSLDQSLQPKAKNVTYTLLTTSKGEISWKGYSCATWTHTKRIEGSFWVGSFDTTFDKKTVLLNDAECWNMVHEQKCAGNMMTRDGSVLQYVDPPKGDGKWYSTVEHTVLNCVIQEITFVYEDEKSPITTPLGPLNVSLTESTALINHNRIVWQVPRELKTGNCSLKAVFQGSGDATTTGLQGRLVDHRNQIEILFNAEKAKTCDKFLNAIKGVPKLFLELITLDISINTPLKNLSTEKHAITTRDVSETEEDDSIDLTKVEIDDSSLIAQMKESAQSSFKQYGDIYAESIVNLPEFLRKQITAENLPGLNQKIKDVEKRMLSLLHVDHIQGLQERYEEHETKLLNNLRNTVSEIPGLSDKLIEILNPLHSQFKEGLEIEHENRLAREIREVYCHVLKTEYNLAILMSQTNGLLAAEALQLKPCSRLEGFGKTLILSECKPISVDIRSTETKCGFQPLFKYKAENYTIGKDGWSIHPFHECFWSGQFININGKTYSWKSHNSTQPDWEEQKLNIHLKNLNLIDKYTEIVLNDFDFTLKHNPAHIRMELEQGNILAELVGRVQDTSSKTVANLVLSENHTNQFSQFFNWTHIIRLTIISVVSFIIITLIVYVCCLFQPFRRISFLKDKFIRPTPQKEIEMSNIQPPLSTFPLTNMPLLASAPPKYVNSSTNNSIPNSATIYPTLNTNTHSHTKCSYVEGKGLCWEDQCPCSTNQN